PFERIELLFGPGALECFARSRVLLLGAGAVGATAAESLVRSGIGHLTLVDFDEFRASNLNRHPFAFRSTLGHSKAETTVRFLHDIHPEADILARSLFVDASNADALLAEHPSDVLLDAIDSLLPKTDFLLAAQRSGHPYILSCLGAARKTDPMRFAVADLFDTHTCPLAHLLRKRLRRRGAGRGISCIFSTEPPTPMSGTNEEAAPDFLDRGRRRAPMGSLHAVTAAAGQLAARTALLHLLTARPLAAPFPSAAPQPV
ncbi:MAG: ThiF family adenylyltransferase, partial [Verrucomicrobiota bacterium]|nr:ThiF family adenylyltransferase [Verrucomicrobiota bacterium]